MENNDLLQFAAYLRQHHPWLYVLTWVLIIAILILTIAAAICKPEDFFINVLASVVTLLVGFIVFILYFRIRKRDEDRIKVRYDDNYIETFYHDNYRQEFSLDDSADSEKVITYCDILCQSTLNNPITLKVNDDPHTRFLVTDFIRSQYFDLMNAHIGSTFRNDMTVRLTDYLYDPQTNICTLITTRSNYFFNMLTNRAIDYPIQGSISLRELYEFGPLLDPLNKSKFSNHIGINALVILNSADTKRYLVVPKRGKKATVVKNGITASVAIRLKMDNKDVFPKAYNDTLTAEYLTTQCISDNIAHSLMLDAALWQQWQQQHGSISEQIHFLGIGRDIYEGGKPTFFYCVELQMTPDEFFSLYSPIEPHKEKIDAITDIYLADIDTFVPYKNKLRFSALDKQKCILLKRGYRIHQKTRTLPYEKNLLSNILFYKRYFG